MTNPMAEVYKTSFFEARLTFPRFGFKETRYSGTKKLKCTISIVERVFMQGSADKIPQPCVVQARNVIFASSQSEDEVLYNTAHLG